jgi:superfamily I DNA/RNA helicase
MAQVETDATLRHWLSQFAREKLVEGGSWMVERNLAEFTEELIKEDFEQIEKEVLKTTREELHALNIRLKELISSVDKTMRKLALKGKGIMEKHTVTEDDFYYKGKGIGVWCKNILGGEYDPNSYVVKTVTEGKYHAGDKSRHAVVDQALGDGLQGVFEELYTYWLNHRIAYNSARQVLRKIYEFGLTVDILLKMKEYKKEHDLMFISDATRLLTDLVADTDAPFIYEKVGSFYDHFLIDEFQDTSSLQWKSFSPLVANSLAEGKANLIVGDVKQSIYRWRGGELELLQHEVEKQLGSAFISHRELRNNFRSEPSVIRFNNAVFQALIPVLSSVFDAHMEEPGKEAADYIESIYKDVTQQIRAGREEENSGYVHVEFLEKSGRGNEWKELASERLPKIIEELQDKGVPLKEMAILVRNHKDGQQAADILSSYAHQHRDNGYRYDVISNDSLFLAGSPALRLIIAALRYLQAPDNAINRADMAWHYHRVHDGAQESLTTLFLPCRFAKQGEERISTRPEQLLHELGDWSSKPFIDLIEKLIHVFDLPKVKDQYAFLQTFQDHVLRFVSRERGDMKTFLTWWDERASKESIKVPEDLDAIRIMTIHKSKGLEFHSVIMPYMQWSINHSQGPTLWLTTEEPIFDRVLPLSYSQALDATYYREDYHSERLKALIDNLNMLYVAQTRAAHDLWILAPEMSKNKKSKGDFSGINDVLHVVLGSHTFPLAEAWDEATKTFSYGQRDFVFEKELHQTGAPERLMDFEESHWQDKLILKPVSASVMIAETRVKINTGIIIHNLLSSVRYLSDFEAALSNLAWEEALSKEEIDHIKHLLKTSMKDQRIRNWFSTEWKVLNEATILTPTGEYRPDRVMIGQTGVVIVDYKTGLQRTSDQQQMKHYISLIREMENLPVRGFLWYIDLNEIQEI